MSPTAMFRRGFTHPGNLQNPAVLKGCFFLSFTGYCMLFYRSSQFYGNKILKLETDEQYQLIKPSCFSFWELDVSKEEESRDSEDQPSTFIYLTKKEERAVVENNSKSQYYLSCTLAP